MGTARVVYRRRRTRIVCDLPGLRGPLSDSRAINHHVWLWGFGPRGAARLQTEMTTFSVTTVGRGLDRPLRLVSLSSLACPRPDSERHDFTLGIVGRDSTRSRCRCTATGARPAPLRFSARAL